MSDFWRAALGLFAAVSPLGAVPVFLAATASAAPRQRIALAAAGCAAGFALLAGAIAAAGTFLGWIDVSPESFQLAAGSVMLPVAVHLIWSGQPMSLPEEEGNPRWWVWLMPLTFPLVAGPAAVAAALSYGTRFGEGTALAAAAAVAALTAAVFALAPVLQRSPGPTVIGALGRMSGALLAILAVELMLDGVQSV